MKPQNCPVCGKKARMSGRETYCSDSLCPLYQGYWPVELWNRIRIAPIPTGPTIPVRIAVVTTGDKQYVAEGNDRWTDDEAFVVAENGFNGEPLRRTIVTADVYLPVPPKVDEVQGMIEEKTNED